MKKITIFCLPGFWPAKIKYYPKSTYTSKSRIFYSSV